MTGISRREALRILAAAAAGLAASGARLGGDDRRPSRGPIHTRRIPSTGEAIPVIGLGTARTFDVGATEPERAPLREVLGAFAGLGGRLVDTSPMYGNAEAVVGELATALGLGGKLFLATKVWTRGRQAGIEQMQESMKKLRTERLDLIQVHNLLDLEIHLETLQAWKREGRVRYLGVTHYAASAHDEVARILASRPVDFLQINYSVAERGVERRVLPLAMERGVAVLANRPFAAGVLLRRLRGQPLPSWASELDCESWAELLLKFVVSHPAITCAIPATSRLDHLRSNMAAGFGRLPDEALRARIAEVTRA